MKPALIKLTKKIIITNSFNSDPYRKIFVQTYRVLVQEMIQEGFDSWDEVEKHTSIANQINDIFTDYAVKAFIRHRLNELDLDKRVFRTLPTAETIKTTVLKGNKQNDEDYQLALYLLSDTLTLVNEDNNSFLLAIEDKSKEIKNSVEFDVFSITKNEDYVITKYQVLN